MSLSHVATADAVPLPPRNVTNVPGNFAVRQFHRLLALKGGNDGASARAPAVRYASFAIFISFAKFSRSTVSDGS